MQHWTREPKWKLWGNHLILLERTARLRVWDLELIESIGKYFYYMSEDSYKYAHYLVGFYPYVWEDELGMVHIDVDDRE